MTGIRIQKLRELFAGAGIEALLITGPENRFYVSGFTGSAGVAVVAPDDCFLITDFRYAEQAREEASGFKVIAAREDLLGALKDVIPRAGVRRVGFEEDLVSYHQAGRLREKLPGVELVPVRGLVEALRRVKSPEEISALQAAARAADRAFYHVRDYLRPGVREVEVAAEVEYFFRREYGSLPSFPTIVASGSRASLPHGAAGMRRLEQGDLVVLDFGCVLNHYCSDLTRTVAIGRAPSRAKKVYRVVMEAQQQALGAIREGVPSQEVDRKAREIIGRAGYGRFFGHSLGHGVGLSVHEEPSLSPSSSYVLEQGAVVTVEPGIYIPGWGGVRIEDMVVITAEGATVLTSAPKEFMIIE